MDKTVFKVFVTAHALTQGIYEAEVRFGHNETKYVYTDDIYRGQFILGKTCFLTLEEARVDAAKQAIARVASLKKQIAAIEKKAEAWKC